MTVKILIGDALHRLREMEADSIDCILTSPPYWRQRDYGMPGQIGLEATPEEYVANLVAVFHEARRVLRADGTAWITIGDKWASGGLGDGGTFMVAGGHAWDHARGARGWRKRPAGYKDKDLVGVPFMLAFALRADGWYWRQCNVWAKPNGMPESVSDRTTIGHEYVLHLSKSADYWYDAEAVMTAPAASTVTRLRQDVAAQAGSARAHAGGKINGPMKAVARRSEKQRGHTRRHEGFNARWDAMEKSEQMAMGGNLRSVWWIAPAHFSGAHYAVMPDRLAEICIRAGCPEGGAVLDPFAGAGTTGLSADRLGRNAVLIELNHKYVAMARQRLAADQAARGVRTPASGPIMCGDDTPLFGSRPSVDG